MKIMFLITASLVTVPAGAVQDSDRTDSCKAMDVMMGAHRAELVKPDRSTQGVILPKAQIEGTGPAVLAPNCKQQEKKRRRKNDYPMA